MLIVHIGLPKTGTTFLQHRVLAPSPGLDFVHRKYGPEQAAIAWEFRRFADAGPFSHPFRRRRLLRLLRDHAARTGSDPSRPVVVSEENISIMPVGFWRGKGPSPDGLARRLAALGARLDGRLAPLKVVIGLRSPDQWLASRYAESSKHSNAFTQEDFDRRVAAIAGGAPLEGPLAWLDQRRVASAFVDALGAEKVLLLPLERLAGDPAGSLADLGRFLGGVALAKPPSGRSNRLGVGKGVWRMRRDESRLELKPEMAAALRARLAP